ncbi:MAG TPA: S26 family signal peptidase [Candidatus Saccharimonadales bacterium]|nr:S26 family signal peptidase [Candidatus Saccharimonadales bacterium]
MFRRVVGESMSPVLQPGDIVVSLPLKVRAGDVVLATQAGREVVKRVAKIDDRGYFLVGDNMTKSTDSRKHGSVKKQDILGRVIVRLPKAVAPVKPKTKLATYLSLVLATMMVLLSVINLSRIDQLVPTLNGVLPGDQTTAAWAVIVIAMSQLLAVPYLLGLKISPLAHVVSGFLSVLTPLIWCLIAIWSLGQVGSVGLFSSYIDLPASWPLTVLLLLWLTASYVNLYYRNFEAQAQRLAKRA